MLHAKCHNSLRQQLALCLIFIIANVFLAPAGFARNNRSRIAQSNESEIEASPAQAQADFIRHIPLTVNDVVFSSATGKLYASVPSAAGPSGNSITTIDPTSGSIDNSVFIGSEPNLLDMSDDGNSLYASLEGAFALRKFDIQTQTAGMQFSVGQDSFFGRYRVNDLAVAPGNPNLVAIARHYQGVSPPQGGVAVFDTGVQRPQTGPGHSQGSDFLAFSASSSKLYGGGFSGTLTTMTVDNNGITVTATAPFSVGSVIKFNNGRIFSSTGQVIDADAGTLLGTFPAATSRAFVADTTVGRAYYVVAGQPMTLKAFDVNTFLNVGSLPIPGAAGDATALVRWGSNGLALRTSMNQLIIIQTSLIPSSDPIPTPTPTPSPTPSPSPQTFNTFVRQIPLATNDLIYDQSTQKIYASVPSTAGSIGNSITPINPLTGDIGNSVFVGSEPTKLAPSDDGQTLYVGLDGAGAVRRFNIATQTAGQQFSLGLDNFNGVYTFSDLSVAPGNPDLVAVARQHRATSPSEAGVAVFDNGVRRPNTQPGHNAGSDYLAFSDSASTLYGAGFSGLSTMTVGVGGITVNNTRPFFSGTSIKFHNGLIYGGFGQVINPVTGTLVGTFSGLGFGNFSTLFTIDPATNRVFFLTGQGSTANLTAYDINTFLPVGSVTIENVQGFTVTSLVRWGTNGVAFRTGNGKVFLVQTSLIDATEPVPAPTPTPSPTPSPSPAYIPTFVRRVDLQANNIVYSPATQAVYASVPSTAGANGNSITKITPETGVIGSSVFVGSEPNKLALADDGQTLYVNLDGANSIRRFDVSTETPGLQFAASAQPPADMEVLPGSPGSVAVSRGISSGVVIYDNGVPRPNTSSGSFYAVGPIEFGSSAATLYGYDSYSSGFELVKFSVNASGLTTVSVTNNLLTGYINGFEFANGLIYSGSGRIADPETNRLVGTLQGGGNASVIAVDTANGRAFYVASSGSNVVLTAFDINTFLPIGSVVLPGIAGNPVNLIRWGTNGLAFNTVNGFGSPGSPNVSQVYLLQTALVSASGTIPTGLQLNSATVNAFEGLGSVQVTVSRTGDVSSVDSVNYSTADGTATAGSDYTSTSGVLTFAAGELTKTISIPILDDNLYEAGSESFSISLSNPSGGVLLTAPSTCVITILDTEQRPSVFIASSLSFAEGNAGTKNFSFAVTLSNPSTEVVTVQYTTVDGTALAGSDYVAASGTLTFPAGSTSMTVNVSVNGDSALEPNETFQVRLSNASNVSFISNPQSTATIVNDDFDSTLQFGSVPSAAEANGFVDIPVTRIGSNSVPATVDFLSSDGTATQLSDYTTASGTLNFAAGETTKNITVLLTDDALVEGPEWFTLTLLSPGGAGLGTTTVATINIADNDAAAVNTNPVDNPQTFVRHQYYDFLNRFPDQDGWDYWTSQITLCGNDQLCIHQRRIGVSAAFFVENEFQRTGSVVYRIYRAALGTWLNAPTRANISFQAFMTDRGQLFDGPALPQSTINFANAFVQRPAFLQAYPSGQTNAQFVNGLFDMAGLTPYTNERQAQIFAMFSGKTRAQVLLDVIEINEFKTREYNRSFVLMQYFGYLRRDPDQGGYDFWLNVVDNRAPNNYRAMVCAFLTSSEYQERFGTAVTRTNADCAQ